MTALIEQMLRRDEGERLRVYEDTEGHPTIGVGRCLDTKGITPAESALLLSNDIAEVTQGCIQYFPWYVRLSEERQAVVQSMVFQLGIAGVLQFHDTLSCISAGAWLSAGRAMRESKWYQQTPERVERLARQMETGVFQP